MTAAWGGICWSDPPSIAISLRKATYTYGSLMARRAFTVNVPAENQVQAADDFGVVSGHDTDKFAATGLTPIRSELVDAPISRSSPSCWMSRRACPRACRAAHAVRRSILDVQGRRQRPSAARSSGNRQGAADHLFARKSGLLRPRRAAGPGVCLGEGNLSSACSRPRPAQPPGRPSTAEGRLGAARPVAAVRRLRHQSSPLRPQKPNPMSKPRMGSEGRPTSFRRAFRSCMYCTPVPVARAW